jgi:hypothetical protein
MIDHDDLELRLATTLAPMQLAIAVFSLGASSFVPNAKFTIIDELLFTLASFCIFSAALLIDSALDKHSLDFSKRLSFLSGGYVSFCLVVAVLGASVPLLYEAKKAGSNPFGWHISFIPFIGAGLSVFLKMMTFRDRNAYTVCMIIFCAWTIYVLGQ